MNAWGVAYLMTTMHGGYSWYTDAPFVWAESFITRTRTHTHAHTNTVVCALCVLWGSPWTSLRSLNAPICCFFFVIKGLLIWQYRTNNAASRRKCLGRVNFQAHNCTKVLSFSLNLRFKIASPSLTCPRRAGVLVCPVWATVGTWCVLWKRTWSLCRYKTLILR